MSKTKACHCCAGSGTELDNKAVGAEMRALRESRDRSLRWVGRRVGHCAPYLCDLEHGHRNWTMALVGKYKKALA